MSDPNDDIVFKLRHWKLRTDLRVAIDQAADEIERLRASLEWLRAWRTKDPESIDDEIESALANRKRT